MNTHKEPDVVISCGCGSIISPDNYMNHITNDCKGNLGTAPLEPKEGSMHSGELTAERMNEARELLEPTPPSQIEETLTSSFEQGYEMGVKHGRVLALKELEIEKLSKEIEELK